MQLLASDLQIGGGGEDLAEQAAGFVVGAGVVRREQAGQGGLGVVGGQPGGVGDALVLRVKPAAGRPQLADGGPGGGGGGVGAQPVAVGLGVVDRAGEGVVGLGEAVGDPGEQLG